LHDLTFVGPDGFPICVPASDVASDREGFRLRAPRVLGDWSATGGKLATTFDLLFRKRRRLRPRLKAEAARRGRTVPNVRFPGEERRP
jgi:hypothetical protein